MKICHLCTGYPISYQGGITNYVRALAESQCKAGHETWVVSKASEENYSFFVQTFESRRIKPFSLRPLIDKEGLKEIRHFLEEKQFDIIHLHMILDVDWDLYKVLAPYKYVVSLHDYFYLCPRIVMMQPNDVLCTCYDEVACSKCVRWVDMVRGFNRVELVIQKYLGWKNFKFVARKQKMTQLRFSKMQRLLEGADLLLPVSSRVQEIYQQSGIQGNYQVLHIGNITADQFTSVFRENSEKEMHDIVMLGNLNYMKGAELFIKLAERLDRQKYCVHFYGRAGAYTDRINAVGIVDHGPYRQEDLKEILANADIGCLLSVWEDNGPQVVMEMINNHVPVVGTTMGGIPDFVHDGENGFLVDPYSEESFESLISKLNSLTRQEIIQLKRNIRPTVTTYDHANAVYEAYCRVLNH